MRLYKSQGFRTCTGIWISHNHTCCVCMRFINWILETPSHCKATWSAPNSPGAGLAPPNPELFWVQKCISEALTPGLSTETPTRTPLSPSVLEPPKPTPATPSGSSQHRNLTELINPRLPGGEHKTPRADCRDNYCGNYWNGGRETPGPERHRGRGFAASSGDSTACPWVSRQWQKERTQP